MNKRMLAKKGPYNRVTIEPRPRRITVDGEEQPPLDDEWIVQVQDRRPIIQNTRTGHCASLQRGRLRQFDDRGRDANGIQRGHYRLNVTLILSGPNLFYSYKAYVEARRTRPQIFYDPTGFA